jgi:hypothetical protein
MMKTCQASINQSTQKGDTKVQDGETQVQAKNHQEIGLQGEQKQIKNSNPLSRKEHIK